MEKRITLKRRISEKIQRNKELSSKVLSLRKELLIELKLRGKLLDRINELQNENINLQDYIQEFKYKNMRINKYHWWKRIFR